MPPRSLTRRQLLATGAALAAACYGIRARAATAVPPPPGGVRRLLVGFPAGGTADGLARALGAQLEGSGTTYVVENKSGAAGQLAADQLRLSTPDGSALLLTPSSVLTLAPQLYQQPLYDTKRDFLPVAGVCDHAFGLAVPGDSELRDLDAFMAWVRANPDQMTYATPGAGSGPHFLGVALAQAAGAPMVHVPYRGVTPGLQDLVGRQVGSTLNPLPSLLEYHRAGRIRLLAVSSPTRFASLPDVPTFTEAGYPSLELVEWYGLFAPSRLPTALAAQMSAQVGEVLAQPAMAQVAQRLEVIPRYEDSAALTEMVARDMARWQALVASTGIRLDG